VNHKRIERIWSEYGFTLPARRKRKKVRTGQSVPVSANCPNHVWTYDFMFDATFGGRRMKVLTVIDEFTREALAIVPARSLTASALKGVLARLFAVRGKPSTIRSDNGPEFIAFELTEWLEAQGANFSVPGAGKTTVCYAVHDAERSRGRVEQMLVVAPLSAFEAWETEADSCFCEPPVINRYDGSIPPNTQVLLTNYQRLREPHISRITAWVLARPTHIVLDEAHRMKRGGDGEWGRACLELAYAAERRDILTGTPAPHSPRDLLALFDFVWPGQANRMLPQIALQPNPPAGSMELVNEAIKPFFVRTTKRELGLDPPLLHTEMVSIEGLQSEIYDAMRNRYAGMFDLSRDDRLLFAQMGGVMMYLLEAATNPALLAKRTADQPAASFVYPSLAIPVGSSLSELIRSYHRHEIPPKFIRLSHIVDANAKEGRKTLVWSNFVGNLLSLERVLAPHQPALVYGGIPSIVGPAPPGVRTREGELKRFRADDACHVLLANPAALAEGVSLHETCHDAVYVDRTFNAGQYLQSLDRIHRLGLPPGTRTTMTFLVSEGTIDQRVDERVAEKAHRLAGMLNDPDLVEMALPDDEDYGEPIEDEQDLRLLLGHLHGDD